MELIYKKDNSGKDILCDKEEKHQVMMEWEKPYMEESIKQLNPFGKVLEIGFGLGYTATKICGFTNVTEYNVIECTPIVWDKFEEFKSDQQLLRPALNVNLIKGRWEDVLQTTGIYDCIYFDDYILSCNQVINDRFDDFLYKVLLNHTKIGSKISVYSNNNLKEKYNNINCVKLECIEYKIDIPDYCKYAKGDKMYIPILTKIKEADVDLKEKIIMRPENRIPQGLQEQIKKEIEIKKKCKSLFEDIKSRNPSCGLIVIDNFYNNAIDTRNYILTQEFKVRGNYPGQRTISYANKYLQAIIQKYVEPFGGKITDFPIPKADGSDADKIYNGSFQFTTSRDRSWIHIDGFNNWAGVIYLTPDAPSRSGTAFYKLYDGTTCKKDMELLDNKKEIDRFSQDLTKWEEVDKVGNVFNRLILFNSNRFHMSMDYFGDTKENGRLFQVFFFSTEK
jgi:hypothetical protein